MTTVRHSMFYTRNLGNFENVKVGYEVEDDLRPGETPDEARSRIKKKVGQWIIEDIEEIDREAKG
jgi:hypothetical protein